MSTSVGLGNQMMVRYQLRGSQPGNEIWLAWQSLNFPQIWVTATVLDQSQMQRW